MQTHKSKPCLCHHEKSTFINPNHYNRMETIFNETQEKQLFYSNKWKYVYLLFNLNFFYFYFLNNNNAATKWRDIVRLIYVIYSIFRTVIHIHTNLSYRFLFMTKQNAAKLIIRLTNKAKSEQSNKFLLYVKKKRIQANYDHKIWIRIKKHCQEKANRWYFGLRNFFSLCKRDQVLI